MPQSFSPSDTDKKFCITLARKSIEYYLKSHVSLWVDEEVMPKKLKEKKACFVTITIDSRLRGCIGHLKAIQELYLDIIENATSSAFSDPRFPKLKQEELSKIKVEVSILTDPTPLTYTDSADLLKKIKVGKDGLIIKKGYNSATFLPSVWEQIPLKENFLSHLCVKAGLDVNEWRSGSLKVEKYEAIKAVE